MSYYIFFEGVCFVLSYSTHIWNAYVDGNLLKLKNAKHEVCLYTMHNLPHRAQVMTTPNYKPNYKNPRSFEHAKFVVILKCNTVPCRIFRGISF